MEANSRQDLNRQLAQMLKGGVIMDVTTPEQARIAEEAGACAVMALERIPADIRAAGGVSRMSDPKMIRGIQEAVTIPVMAKCRIGHIAEAQILQAIEIDYIDESEVLSPADNIYHIDKTKFDVPFVCGAKNLGEALRRIAEGATMIRTKGEPGTGDVVQAVSHMRLMQSEIRRLVSMSEDELYEAAKQLQSPYELVRFVHDNGKLPVVNFAAGGVATPADAALMMQLGAEGVFVGSGIFKSGNPAKRAAAIVKAVTNEVDRAFFREKTDHLRKKYGYTEYEGEPIEFHASGMVTFGLLGTAPSAEHKVAFDPDRKKRRAMYPEVCEIFKDFSVYIGGSTSFDFAGKDYNKYDATLAWAEDHGYTLDDIVFIGDDFADGGGDSHVRIKGMDHIVITDYRKFAEAVGVLIK